MAVCAVIDHHIIAVAVIQPLDGNHHPGLGGHHLGAYAAREVQSTVVLAAGVIREPGADSIVPGHRISHIQRRVRVAVNPLGLAPGGVVLRGGVLLVLIGQGGHLVCVLQTADQGVDLAFHLLLQLFVLVTVLGVHFVLGCQLRQ